MRSRAPGTNWGATAAERASSLPCDDVEPVGLSADRAITIDAPPEVVYRWLCKLRFGTFSYRLPGVSGSGVPRQDPEPSELEIGQEFMSVFTLHSYVEGRHITLVSGRICATYAVLPEGAGTRLAVRVRYGGSQLVARVADAADLVMARKQLRTLKQLVESEK